MNKILFFLLALPIASIAGPQLNKQMSAKDIMAKNDEVRRVNEFQTSARLTTGSKIKTFTLWRKVQDDNIHNNTMTRFHSPAEVRNEGILIIENASGRNDVLLYLPTFKKIRRVESQQQSGSFMGSAFSYSDIATPHVEDYTYKIIREEKCPSAEAPNVLCWMIEAIPANEDVKERTGYNRSNLWVRQDNFMTVQNELFGLDNALLKKMVSSKIRIVDEKNRKWLAHDLYIQNLKTQEFTRLEFSNVKVNGGISKSIFTQQNLQKVQ